MSNLQHQPDPNNRDNDDQTVVNFPASKEISEEESARRIMAEATRLAGLAPGEWKIWIDGSAERLGIVRDKLEAVVVEIIKANQKSKREGPSRGPPQRATGREMPRQLASRSIVIKLWPKKAEEKVENFAHIDDEVFAALRSKLARWAKDNAAGLKDAEPVFPANFNNRLRANWRLLLAIGELAGGSRPKEARDAAERVARTIRKPSYRLQLLEAFHALLVVGKRKEITSADLVAELNPDRNGVWCEYNRGGPVSQRMVADLLDQYDIHPTVIHPTKRKNLSLNGYKVEQFAQAFACLLPSIRTSKHSKQTGK
jgi:hypothetical protein